MLILLHLVDIVTKDVPSHHPTLLPARVPIPTSIRHNRFSRRKAKKTSQAPKSLQALSQGTIPGVTSSDVFLTSALDGTKDTHPHPLRSHRLSQPPPVRTSIYNSLSRRKTRRSTLGPSFAPRTPTPTSRITVHKQVDESPTKHRPTSHASDAFSLLTNLHVKANMQQPQASSPVPELADPFTSPSKSILHNKARGDASPPKLKAVIVSTNPATMATFACTNSPIISPFPFKPRLVAKADVGEASPSPLKIDPPGKIESPSKMNSPVKGSEKRDRSHSSPWKKEFLDGAWKKIDFVEKRRSVDIRVEEVEEGSSMVVGTLSLSPQKGGVGID